MQGSTDQSYPEVSGIAQPSRRTTPMSMCQLSTKAGQPCPFQDLGRGLCHLHDPDASYSVQHARRRETLLARADVQAILAGRPPLAAVRVPVDGGHCMTCRCSRGQLAR